MAKMGTTHQAKKVVPRKPAKGGAQHQPAPNGGEVRGIGDAQTKMPKKQNVRPITHTKLEPITEKMPKTLGGARQRDPHRR